MGAVNASAGPSATQVATVQVQQLTNQVKSLDVMQKMQSGKISPEDGQKQLQALVTDQAQLQESLAPGKGHGNGKGFSAQDGFEAPAAKPIVDLSGGVAAAPAPAPTPADTSYLEGGGGGAKPGIAGGTS